MGSEMCIRGRGRADRGGLLYLGDRDAGSKHPARDAIYVVRRRFYGAADQRDGFFGKHDNVGNQAGSPSESPRHIGAGPRWGAGSNRFSVFRGSNLFPCDPFLSTRR